MIIILFILLILLLLDKSKIINIDNISNHWFQKASVSGVDFVYGDVNEDLIIDNLDTTLVQEYLAGITQLSAIQKKAAGYNGDGIIDISDVIEI